MKKILNRRLVSGVAAIGILLSASAQAIAAPCGTTPTAATTAQRAASAAKTDDGRGQPGYGNPRWYREMSAGERAKFRSFLPKKKRKKWLDTPEPTETAWLALSDKERVKTLQLVDEPKNQIDLVKDLGPGLRQETWNSWTRAQRRAVKRSVGCSICKWFSDDCDCRSR
jgi:hypothetical protein